jgi:S-layer homology domain
VPTGIEHHESMAWLAVTGVTTGWATPAGPEYRPTSPVNRDAMAAFLYRFAGSPAYTPPTTSPFVDVATSNLYYKEIAWLRDRGISAGWETVSGREFRPYEPVKRDAMAAFLYRFAGSPTFAAPATSPFADVAPAAEHYREMAWLSAAGVSTGWAVDGRREYRSLQPVARDAMAAFLERLTRIP